MTAGAYVKPNEPCFIYMLAHRLSRFYVSHQTFSLHSSRCSMLDAGRKQFPEVLHEAHIGSVKGGSPASPPQRPHTHP